MGIALSQSERKLYWTDCSLGTISRASFDGSGPVLVSGLAGPRAIALDEAGGTMYWSETGAVRRANLDGQSTVVSTSFGQGIALVLPEGCTGRRRRRRRTSTEAAWRRSSPISTRVGIAVDPDEGKLYWTETESGKIQRANLDGSSVEDLVGGLNTPSRTRPPPGRELPTPPPPPNDDFDSATVIGSLPGETRPSLATRAADEPAGCDGEDSSVCTFTLADMPVVLL